MTRSHETPFCNRDALTDHGNTEARRELLDIASAALRSVHPSQTVPAVLTRDADRLVITQSGDEDADTGRTYDLDAIDDVVLIGAGKGSTDVVEAVATHVGDRVTDGLVAEKEGQVRPLESGTHADDVIEVIGAGHPIPTERSREAGERVLELAATADADDLVIVCITGGASAQLVAPTGDVDLADLVETNRLLLQSGARIEEINAVRKHLSRLKGGRLADAIAPARLCTLVVVDEVAGDPWGPTVRDVPPAADAWAVLTRYSLLETVPRAVRDELTEARNAAGSSLTAETSSSRTLEEISNDREQTVVLARPTDLCDAARYAASTAGYEPAVLSTAVAGESQTVAGVLASIATECATANRPIEPPCVLISGGETTVTLPEEHGTGGPNQEFALRTAIEHAAVESITTLAIDTDGTDGPTRFAGGLVDHSTTTRLDEAGVDAESALRTHDATTALAAVDDAVDTGRSGTNVNDLRLALVDTDGV